MTPENREKLAADLRQAEGLRLKAYRDTEGVLTCGFGTNLEQLTITRDLADQWLNDKILEAEHDAQTFPWYAGLDSVRQRAIVELLYNLGLTRLRLFRVALRALAAGEWDAAATAFLASKWARQVGPTRAGRIARMVRTGAA